MDNSLDIDVLPIFRRGGFDQSELPGLHLAVPPRRTARGRKNDVLIQHLALKGSAPFSSSQQAQLLAGLTKTYYQTRGSVTAAMRAAADRLNQYLLDRNLRSSSSGLQTIGLLTLVVVHGDVFYLAQSGPTHAFILAENQSQHLYDPNIAGRGLGLSRTTVIRFSQARMETGGLLIVSPAPPPTWTAAALKGTHQLKLGSLYRHLLNQAGPDLAAVVMIAQPGEGEIHLLQRERPVTPAATETPATTGQGAPARPAPAGEVQAPTQAPAPAQAAETTGSLQEALTEERSAAQPGATAPSREAFPAEFPARPQPVDVPASEPLAQARDPAASGYPALSDPAVAVSPLRPAPDDQPAPQRPGPSLPAIGPALLTTGRALNQAWSEVVLQIRTLLGRMLPGEGLFTLPSSVMALIAISVPLILVTVASVVYFQRGRTAQHQANFEQAKQAAQQTVGQENPLELRAAWESTLFYLDRAEEYQITPESRALRNLAEESLDMLNGVTRLSFQPAIVGGLSDAVNVKRMVATSEDLYLLDANEGSVLRAWLTGRGYEMDPTFRCGPGAYGAYIIGPLIDMAPLPKGNDLNATLLAMDVNGNLLYCIPGEAPLSTPLVPPDSNWGQPVALTVDTGNLYVLDPRTNAVWIYRGSNGAFGDRPRLFFSEDIPPMQNVIGLANNRQDLYLLHSDGHITTCTFSAVAEAPTRCTDPAIFSDPRPGRQDGQLIPDALFTQILFSPPPDPSIYLMDPNTQSIYHFSLRLTLQRQFRSETPVPEEPATAFTISPNRTVFLAFGRQVYYASFP